MGGRAILLQTNGSGAVNNAVTSALAAYPNVQVQTRAQFEQAQTASVNPGDRPAPGGRHAARSGP
jgi:hypothetical protein